MFTDNDVADGSRPNVPVPARAAISMRFPPHIVFLVVAGVQVILLCALTPPFQIHDEFQHFFRSYQLSELHIWGTVQDGKPGGVIPSALPEFVERTWGTLRVWYAPPLGEHPLAKTWTELWQPLSPHRREFAKFITATYSPLLYVPQTVGISIGRLFGASPLVLMLLGRLANAVTAILLITWSLKVLPVGRIAALTVALLPMAQYEYASLAPDATIIASGFVLTAITLRAGVRGWWKRMDILTSVGAAAILCCKLVYIPLLAVGLPATLQCYLKGGSQRTVARLMMPQFLIAIFAVGVTVIWLASTSSIMDTWALPSITLAREIAILRNPLGFAGLLVADAVAHGRFYLEDSIGIFGVKAVYLPKTTYVTAIFCSVFSLFLAEDTKLRLGLPAVAWNLLLVAGSIALIQMAMFVLNNPGGAWRIFGVQGRYFLPLGALAAATLASLSKPVAIGRRSEWGYVLLITIIIFDTISMDRVIINGFHLF